VSVNVLRKETALKGNGQALEQKYCLSAVLGDKCDPSANLLNQFNSHLVPCHGSFNDNWEEEVSTRKITILGGLIGSRPGGMPCLVGGTRRYYYYFF